MKFRKKPVVIEAIQLVEVLDGQFVWDARPAAFPQWLADAMLRKEVFITEGGNAAVSTLEGQSLELVAGAWLIRGVKGEIYPCAADVFEATYEAETKINDEQRLNWVLPILGGDTSPMIERRVEIFGTSLENGFEGRDAIDNAIRND